MCLSAAEWRNQQAGVCWAEIKHYPDYDEASYVLIKDPYTENIT